MQNAEKYRDLLKIKTVQLQMVQDRGYTIPNDETFILNEIDPEKVFEGFIKLYSQPKSKETEDKKSTDRTKRSKKTKETKQSEFSEFRNRLSRIYQHTKTIGELLGYDMKKLDVKSHEKSFLTQTAKILVYYTPYSDTGEEGKIGKPILEEFQKLVTETHDDLYQAILISPTALSTGPQGGQEVMDKMILNQKTYVQLFYDSSISNNVVKHVLQPEFTLLSPQEADMFLKHARLTLQRLPQMHYDDPVAKYYGARPGRIFRILRSLPLDLHQEVYYRAVTITAMPIGDKKSAKK